MTGAMARMRSDMAVTTIVVSVVMLRQFGADYANVILGGGALREMPSAQD